MLYILLITILLRILKINKNSKKEHVSPYNEIKID